jgi:hypothetical protein
MSLRLALCAVALHASAAVAADSPCTTRPAASPRGTSTMSMLSKKTLRACRDPGVVIALVRVTKAEIDNPGTRSEMAVLDLAVERPICGEAPPSLSAWRYTSRGNTVLQEGRRYVAVCARGVGPVDYGLGDFVPVPEGKETEIVDAHLAAVKRTPATGK